MIPLVYVILGCVFESLSMLLLVPGIPLFLPRLSSIRVAGKSMDGTARRAGSRSSAPASARWTSWIS